MNNATMFCNGTSAELVLRLVQLTKDFDAGSKIVVYLSANNGSNASPAANVSKNYAEVSVERHRHGELHPADHGAVHVVRRWRPDRLRGQQRRHDHLVEQVQLAQLHRGRSDADPDGHADRGPTPTPTEARRRPRRPRRPRLRRRPRRPDADPDGHADRGSDADPDRPTPTPTPTPTWLRRRPRPRPRRRPRPRPRRRPRPPPRARTARRPRWRRRPRRRPWLPTPTPTAAPTPTPTATPLPSEAVQASILIAKYDNKGTESVDDDVALDGATFEVYLDDGDGSFDATSDTLAFGPATTVGGLLDTDPLDEGSYWIVETVVPAGYTGSDPILVDLNIDSAVTCVWDALGLVECIDNDGDVDGLSWTIVEVENTPAQATGTPAPTATPTGEVEGATGTPNITLPPTDTALGGPAAPDGDGWRLVLLAMAGLLAAALLLTPAGVVIRKDDRR